MGEFRGAGPLCARLRHNHGLFHSYTLTSALKNRGFKLSIMIPVNY